MNTAISREFHFGSLLRFAMPTILMMIFMSLYTIVDGIFVSNYVGTDALSATNLVYPAINLVLAVAVMLSTGGNAVVARKMGEGKHREAMENFSLVVITGVISGVIISILGLFFLEPVCRMLGATPELLGYCKNYLSVLLLFAPAFVLQILFQTFFVTAGKPALGLTLTILAGITNALLDYLLIVPGNLGIIGAALATAAGYMIPAICGLIFFSRTKSQIHFTRPKLDWRMLGQSCFNGSSEMVTNISAGIITFLFNLLMLYFVGSDGVAAITIVLYAQFLLTALYLGFSMGVAPVISYNHGSGNTDHLKRIFRICMVFICVSSAVIFGFSLLSSSVIVGIFSAKGTPVYDMALRGFLLFSLSFLFAGLNIFSSGMFTAFSNGRVSAIISFLRTFVFIILGLLILPWFLNVDGIWLAVPLAELLTLVMSVVFLKKFGSYYQYS